MGAAGELKATGSNAYTSKVPTTADSGSLFDSHIRAQYKSRPVLSQRGILRRSQSEESESSEDEEESDGPSSVGGSLPPASRHESRLELNYDLPLLVERRKNKQLSTVDETRVLSAVASSLTSQDRLSCNEKRSPKSYAPAGSTNHPLPQSRSRDRRSVSFGRLPSRNRSSTLQQQLGISRNASYQSLVSSLTTSSGSSGSSTATQRSYDKLAVRRRRRSLKWRAPRDRAFDLPKSTLVKNTRTRKMDDRSNTLPKDIGDALKEISANTSRPASSASKASRKDSILSPPTPASRRPSTSSSSRNRNRSSMDLGWKRQDIFNSDSGISVTSSPEALMYELSHRKEGTAEDAANSDSSDDDDASSSDKESPMGLVPTLRASSAAGIPPPSPMRVLPDPNPYVQRLQDQEAALKHHILHSPQPKRNIRQQVNQLPSHRPSPALPLYDPRATSAVPADYPFAPPAPPVSHSDSSYHQSYHDSQDHHLQYRGPQFKLDMKKTTIAGYEQLAQKLSQEDQKSDSTVNPLYRRFEQLNHRVLLHLQDEIAELEEELRALDEMVAQITSLSLPDGEPPQPASRRADARYGADVHFQRAHVLGRIFMKLQQYNQALSSYSTAKNKFNAAAQDDINAYRAWMEKTTPIHSGETGFLSGDHDGDLINPSSRKYQPQLSTSNDKSGEVDIRQIVFLLYVTIVLLLLAFSMLPGFLSKLLLLVIVVACMGSISRKEFPGNYGSIAGSSKDA